ncbi:MAG: type VI secretion protein IcmF/TssM N-terminal domain-containing protein [Sandaracinaceae bacterium]
MFQHLLARRSSRALERAVAHADGRDASRAAPQRTPEIARRHAELERTLATLGRARAGRGARSAVPWYLLIGPPCAGKSTLLRASGLRSVDRCPAGPPLGTRTVEVWPTTDAVLLDTAGRWTSHDEDRDEWHAFLALLRRARPRQPLHGLIAVVSVEDLGEGAASGLAVGGSIRARIDEVQERLAVSVPVYLLLAKCDLVPGFLETFRDLPPAARRQVVGFAAPRALPGRDTAADLGRRFDELVARLEQRALPRMARARGVRERERIFAFADELRSCREPVRGLLGAIVERSLFRETPRLRGVYLTSAAPAGGPIDARPTRATSGAEARGGEGAVNAEGYFVRDVFARVVVPDRDGAVRSPAALARRRRRRSAAAAALYATAVLLTGLTTVAGASQAVLLARTWRLVDEAPGDACPSGIPSAMVLEPLRTGGLGLERARRGSAALHLGLGLHRASLSARVRTAYGTTFARCVLPPLLRRDAARMERRLPRRPADLAADPAALDLAYSSLKLHLLVTGPRAPGEPATVSDAQRAWMRTRLIRRWVAAKEGTAANLAERERIAEGVDAYLAHLADAGRAHAPPRDGPWVARTRRLLRRVGSERIALARLLRRADGEADDVTLRGLLGRELPRVRARSRVPGAFTRRAWARSVEPLLDGEARAFFEERWVLAEATGGRSLDVDRQVAALRRAYLERYAEVWRRFLEGIEVERPRTGLEARRLVEALSSGRPPPWVRMVREVGVHVGLCPGTDPCEPGRRFEGFLAFAPAPSSPGPDRDPAPSPTPASDAVRYQEQLEYLRDAFRPGERRRTAALVRRARAVTEAIIARRPPAWRTTFERLLLPAVSGPAPAPRSQDDRAGATSRRLPPPRGSREED